MSKRKTIADHTLDVLRETDNPAIMFGDCGLLDMVAARAELKISKGRYGTANHPLARWKRVLDGLERSKLFVKSLVWAAPGRRGNQIFRKFTPVNRD